MTTLIVRMLERGGLHFVASTFVFIAVYFVVAWLTKTRPELAKYIFTGFIITAVMANHEIYDLGSGADPISKAYTDVLSWMIGCTAAAYGIYRLRRQNK